MTFRSGLVGLLLVVAVVGAAAPSAAGKVEPVATLRPSQPGAAFSVVAEAHGVLVAGGGVVPEGGAAEVFAAVGSRWVSGREAAVLTGADSQTMLATSGDVVVASSASFAPTDPMVYVKPAGDGNASRGLAAKRIANWFTALRRRSQRADLDWERRSRLASRWLPPARILHPWPDVRFNARTRARSPVR